MSYRIVVLILLFPMSAFAADEYYTCELERMRHDGYAKEIFASVKVRKGVVLGAHVESTLVAPVRGLVGASCDFEVDQVTISKKGFRIDLSGVSSESCKPQGLWPRTLIVVKGQKRCQVEK